MKMFNFVGALALVCLASSTHAVALCKGEDKTVNVKEYSEKINNILANKNVHRRIKTNKERLVALKNLERHEISLLFDKVKAEYS